MIPKNVIITRIVLLQIVFTSFCFSYTPSSDLLKKVDSVVEKIELLISSSWEWYREEVIIVLDSLTLKYADNERSVYILDYMKKEIWGSKYTEVSQEEPAKEWWFVYQYLTPSQTEWPYYPISKPLDTDNNLLQVWDWERAGWEIIEFGWRVGHLDGSLLDAGIVEIWQTDAESNYLHPSDTWYEARDQNFQFYGESTINTSWEYTFTTIVPGEYGSRPSHIHAKVRDQNWALLLTTQIYFSWVESHKNKLDVIATSTQDAQSMLVLDLQKQGDRYRWVHDIVVPKK